MTKTFTEKTNNEAWGFYGTAKSNYNLSDQDIEHIWMAMGAAITQLLTKNSRPADAATVREILDSTHGRHIADEMSFHCPTNPTTSQLKKAIAPTLAVPWVKRCITNFKNYGRRTTKALNKANNSLVN